MSTSHNPNGSRRKAGVLHRVLANLFDGRPRETAGYVNRHGYSHIDDATLAMFGLGRMRFQRESDQTPRF